jgi:hypothetical protein
MFDVFIDLSHADLSEVSLGRFLDGLRNNGLLREGRNITVARQGSVRSSGRVVQGIVLPKCEPVEAFASAISRAAAHERSLAVIRGAWVPSNNDLVALDASCVADPLIASVQPRFARRDDDRVIGLPGNSAGSKAGLSRDALRFLPARLLTAELPAPLLVLSPPAVLAADTPNSISTTVAIAILLTGLRRRGFRNLVDNRVVVVPSLSWKDVYPDPKLSDSDQDHPWQQDADSARSSLGGLPEIRLESILTEAFGNEGRMRLLLDCRGMQDAHNGTSQAILGFLDGFAQLRHPAFEITVTASVSAARFHSLTKRFRDFRFEYDQPTGRYFAAVLLNQPWRIGTVAELHGCAVFVLFSILDTISWDIMYAAPKGLDHTWRSIAHSADGLLFISDFSRQRFNFRFSPDPDIPQVVTYLSLSPEEIAPAPRGAPRLEEPYLLLFGNGLDHKCISPTLTTLRDAFPYTKIVVVGGEDPATPGVTFFRSGLISEPDVNALVAYAAAIIYPSFYEGFGLPVAHGLAHGRIVIVRRSPLWWEIAASCRMPGQLVPFHDLISLVEAVGRALHGQPQQVLLCGATLAEGVKPPSWITAATRITGLLEQLASRADTRRWTQRHLSLRGNPDALQEWHKPSQP